MEWRAGFGRVGGAIAAAAITAGVAVALAYLLQFPLAALGLVDRAMFVLLPLGVGLAAGGVWLLSFTGLPWGTQSKWRAGIGRLVGWSASMTGDSGAHSRPGGVRSRVARSLPWALLLATAINVVVIDRLTTTSAKPLLVHSSSALSDIVRGSGASVRERYSLYVDLAEVAGHAERMVAAVGLLDGHLLRGLSGLELVVDSAQHPELPHLAPGEALRTGRTRTSDGTMAFRLVSSPDVDDVVLFVVDGELLVIVPSRPTGDDT